MSASKIAAYLGVPRTNVLRALASLKKKNIVYSVGNAYLTNIDSLAKRVAPQLMRKQLKTISDAYAELTKLTSRCRRTDQQNAAGRCRAHPGGRGQSNGQAG
jgi:DNA-binding transcriptional regulator LsrR (DeoR family)